MQFISSADGIARQQQEVMCRLTIDAQGSDFGVLFDSSEQVRDAAGWNIWLSLTAVGLLLAAHWLQLTTVSAALLKPLLRMFNAVQAQPGNLLLAAQPSEEVSEPLHLLSNLLVTSLALLLGMRGGELYSVWSLRGIQRIMVQSTSH